MTYATNLRRSLAGAALLLGLGTLPALGAQPDIMIFLADDLGAADNGPIKDEIQAPTPTIDALGKDGIIYTSGYAQPACVQARTALMTGKWPQRQSVGAVYNNGPQPPGSIITIAERLRPLGYGTHLIGKWHLGWGTTTHPLGQGFDTFKGWKGSTPNYVGDDADAPLYNGRTLAHNTGLVTNTIEREVIRLLDLKPTAPQLYYVAWTAPHDPLQGTLSQRVAEMDASMGRILPHLRPDTLVIYAGDNGRGANNDPFKGRKYDIWEGGVRVPFELRWPGHVAAGQRIDTPASLIDVARTVVEAAGGSFPDSDGYNLLALPADRAVLFKAYYSDPGYGVRQGRWKYYQNYLGKTDQLFDVVADQGEKIPVPGFPLIRAQLQALIANFRTEMAH